MSSAGVASATYVAPLAGTAYSRRTWPRGSATFSTYNSAIVGREDVKREIGSPELAVSPPHRAERVLRDVLPDTARNLHRDETEITVDGLEVDVRHWQIDRLCENADRTLDPKRVQARLKRARRVDVLEPRSSVRVTLVLHPVAEVRRVGVGEHRLAHRLPAPPTGERYGRNPLPTVWYRLDDVFAARALLSLARERGVERCPGQLRGLDRQQPGAR